MQKMIWTPRESDLPPLVHSTMHLPWCLPESKHTLTDGGGANNGEIRPETRSWNLLDPHELTSLQGKH
jgi:hypothetical protein